MPFSLLTMDVMIKFWRMEIQMMLEIPQVAVSGLLEPFSLVPVQVIRDVVAARIMVNQRGVLLLRLELLVCRL